MQVGGVIEAGAYPAEGRGNVARHSVGVFSLPDDTGLGEPEGRLADFTVLEIRLGLGVHDPVGQFK